MSMLFNERFSWKRVKPCIERKKNRKSLHEILSNEYLIIFMCTCAVNFIESFKVDGLRYKINVNNRFQSFPLS